VIIRIKNLRLRTIIGVQSWERRKKQDVIVNVRIDFDGTRAAETDKIEESVDYKAITKRIIEIVEQSEFHLLERLVASISAAIMENQSVRKVWVEIDKPHALRFSDSVSIETQAER